MKSHKFYKVTKFFLLVLFCSAVLAAACYALDLDKMKACFLSGDYKSAIAEGEKVMATSEQSAGSDELYYILGLSYLKDGNYLRASDIFEIILKEFKGSAFSEEAGLSLGDTYFLQGDYDKAEALYKEMLGTDSRSKLGSALYYRLGQCALKKGDIPAAKEYMNKTTQEFSQSLEINYQPAADSCPLISDFYTVQVGSFSKKSNADNLAQKLTGNGYPAYAEEAADRGVVSYRVRVGKFSSRKEAQDLESKLAQEGYPTKICP